mmetsp:Transcript_1809/g.4608  ORF Transcript_1809/g.4608 Transcript_1809/m.4608 type:complete len:473 (+) Transcript_1809:105-1523(+)
MISGLELKARTQKLESEQAQRIEKLRQTKEKEAILAARQREREAQRQAEAQRRKQQELEALERAEKEREEWTEKNRGVFFNAVLQAVDADDELAAAKAHRYCDKIVLPSTFSSQLMDLDAYKNGALLFELRLPAPHGMRSSEVPSTSGRSSSPSSSGSGMRTTHAGVLEFSAPEGVIALPSKVRECLWGPGQSAAGTVEVRYKRLEKGTFVEFQPLSRGFHDAVGGDVKQVLEQTLMKHCTLTVGDTLSVEHAGSQYVLRVNRLEPEPAVSIIDTDVEAEVVASVETEDLIREWEAQQEALKEQQRRNAERLAELRAAREREAQEALELVKAAEAEEARKEQEAEQMRLAKLATLEKLRAHREARLPPEPPVDSDQPAVTVAFRLPEGARLSRRFPLSSGASSLFQFVDAKWAPAGGWEAELDLAQGAEGAQPYQLIAQFPRRVISRPSPGSDVTLQQLALSNNELFNVEIL